MCKTAIREACHVVSDNVAWFNNYQETRQSAVGRFQNQDHQTAVDVSLSLCRQEVSRNCLRGKTTIRRSIPRSSDIAGAKCGPYGGAIWRLHSDTRIYIAPPSVGFPGLITHLPTSRRYPYVIGDLPMSTSLCTPPSCGLLWCVCRVSYVTFLLVTQPAYGATIRNPCIRGLVRRP